MNSELKPKIDLELDVETEYEGLKIYIGYDDSPDSPRDWDNLGTMICFHNRYNLGDRKHKYNKENYNSWNELKKDIIKTENVAAILPVYMYDHSGITIRTSPFSCRWDSGQIGFIFVSKETARKEYKVRKITKKIQHELLEQLDGEIKTYDQYLTGQVYYYTIKDSDDDVLDSCYGYYDLDHVKSECLSMVAYTLEEQRRLAPTKEREALEREGQLYFDLNYA